jgi:hypothetical protein
MGFFGGVFLWVGVFCFVFFFLFLWGFGLLENMRKIGEFYDII